MAQWQHISELFDAALDVPSAERDAWLSAACEQDPHVEKEVRSLLDAYERTGILDRDLDPFPTATADVTGELAPDHRVGPYKIIAELGRGGMGVVYKALDERLDRFVALKFLTREFAADKSSRDRLLFEARAASALDHPSICTVYDIGTAGDDQVFIAMAYYEGETLAARMKRGRIATPECLEIALQVARGLQCAHDAGIVHRDVKPSNIIIRPRGDVKILDFGVAKFNRPGAANVGGRVGTVMYASPEQLSGSDVDTRADVWSLGVLLYEMLSGKRPFDGQNEFEIVHEVLNREVQPIEGIPAQLDAAIRSALAKAPEKRLQTIGEFSEVIASTAAALRNATGIAAELPRSLTTFVGRSKELARARSLLQSARLVTLTGPAGTGKTRLSLELARLLHSEFRNGACFVPLAAVTSPDRVLPTIAAALNIPGCASRTVLEDMAESLRGSEMLLVLDNFEQITAAAPLVSDLLQAAPGLRVIVTSRVALRLTGEHEMPISPLETPQATSGSIQQLENIPSVELFLNRARAVDPDFSLNGENAAAIAEICRRLDGLPLAIELAASRIKVLSPQAIASRLGNRLDLLKGGARDRPPRHQTLRQALAWSYDLLGETERRVFRRAGIFTDGFTTEAITALCSSLSENEDEVFDALCSLVDHSLVSQRPGPDQEPRFYLLETIREYALELLRRSGEEERARVAHAGWFSRVAESASKPLDGGEQASWLSRLDADHENLRAALNWLEDKGQIEQALRFCVNIWRFWTARTYHREGRTRMERLLNLGRENVSAEVRAGALNGCATLAHGSCDMSSARALLHEALPLYRRIGDQRGVALVLNNLAWIHIEMSEFEEARKLAEEACELHGDAGDKRGLAVALNNLGWIANYTAEFHKARAYHERSIELRRSIGDSRGVAFGLANLAWAEQRRGRYSDASELLDESLALLNVLQDSMLRAWTCQLQAAVAYDLGRFSEAAELIEQCLPTWRRVGAASGLSFGLLYYSMALLRTGKIEAALEALDEAEAALNAIPQRWGGGVLALARGRAAELQGAEDTALSCCRKAIETFSSLGDGCSLAEAYECAGQWLETSDPRRAVRALATAHMLRESVEAPIAPCDEQNVQRAREALKRKLGPAFDEHWADGATSRAVL